MGNNVGIFESVLFDGNELERMFVGDYLKYG